MPNPMDMQAYGFAQPDGTVKDSQTGESYTQDQWDARFSPSGNQLVTDSSDDVIMKWAKENGYKLNADTMDILYNQFFNEKDTTSAWQRTLSADNTKYQRAVEDMKKAGLNPFLLMSSGASGAGASSPGSVGSGSISAARNAKLQAETSKATAVMSIIGGLIGAAIIALL